MSRLIDGATYPAVLGGAILALVAGSATALPVGVVSYLAVAVAAAVVIALEWYRPYRAAWRPDRRAVGTDAVFLVVVQMLLPLAVSTGALFALGAAGRDLDLSIASWWPHDQPVVVQAALMLVLGDILRYWMHRAFHRWQPLWQIHAVHHSPHRLYWLNVGRFHPVEKATQLLVDSLPFVLLGVSDAVLAGYFVFYAVNGFFQHSNCRVRLGPLNQLISGPELHRWHHSSVIAESDNNFGNNLIVWDTLFGTRFLPTDREVGELGLLNRSYPDGFVAQLTSPFQPGLDKHAPNATTSSPGAVGPEARVEARGARRAVAMSRADRVIDRLVGVVFDLAMRRNHRRFWPPVRAAADDPRQAQADVLKELLTEHAATTFGRAHGFDRIRTADDYRRQVPIQDYESLRPLIERQERIDEPTLTAAPPVLYAQTSGTSGQPKYLPITADSIDRVARIQRLFAARVHRGTGMFAGKIVGIGSPAIEGTLPGGTPFGSASGMIYEQMPSVVRRKYVLSPEVLAIEDHEIRYLVMAARCLSERDVTGVATANPSTLLRLRSVALASFDELVEAVAAGHLDVVERLPEPQRSAVADQLRANPERAAELRRLREHHSDDLAYRHWWPKLAAITTWTGGSCGFALRTLGPLLDPSTRVVELGYSASELRGTIGIDPDTNLCLPLLTENWYEFVERSRRESDPDGLTPEDFLGLHELVPGGEYYLYATTRDGLYRYDMNDIVEVSGHIGATPALTFVQKGRGVTNITGEKVTESQVLNAVAQATSNTTSPPFFVALASEHDSCYRLFVESGRDHSPTALGAAAIAQRVDDLLAMANVEYASKRASGRLGPMVGLDLEPGTGERYRSELVADGQRDAQFKYLYLQYAHQCSFRFDDHLLGAAPTP